MAYTYQAIMIDSALIILHLQLMMHHISNGVFLLQIMHGSLMLMC